MPEYIVRPYKPGDEISINKSFNRIFGEKRSIREWRWKFEPVGERSRIIVAADEGTEIFAQYASTITDLKFLDGVYRCGQPVDVYSVKQQGSIQHRLYIKAAREFFDRYAGEDKIQCFYGFPSARVLKLGQLTLDYGEQLPVPVGRRHVRDRSLVFTKNPLKLATFDPGAVNRLWLRSSGRYPAAVVRDGEYFKRRYLDRPGNRYFYLSIENGDDVRAFGVFSYTKSRKKSSVRWIDLIWDGQDEGHLTALDELVERTTREAGADNNEIWIANDPDVRNLLIKRGWEFSSHEDILFVTNSYHPLLDRNKFLREFYFTMGDSDIV